MENPADIDRAVHQVTYQYNGVRYQRTAFASHPDGVIVIHLTADKPAAYTGRVQLADMHEARIGAEGNKLSSVGKLKNGFEYEAQLLVQHNKQTVDPNLEALLCLTLTDHFSAFQLQITIS
jgi:alpha-L-fucosidase 2